MGLIKSTISTLGILGGVYAGVSAALAANLTRLPEPYSETGKTTGQPVKFTARGSDIQLSGQVFSSGEAVPKNRWILFNTGDIPFEVPEFRFNSLITDLTKSGFNVFQFDLRGRGRSSDSPSTLGDYERLDLLGAIDYLEQTQSEDLLLGLLGVDLGGVVSLLVGSNAQAIQAVVSDGAFADLADHIESNRLGFRFANSFWMTGVKFWASRVHGIDISDVSPARHVARSETPVLVIHGAEDSLVSPSHARHLGRAIGASFQELEKGEDFVWMVAGAEHGMSYSTAPDEYSSKVVKFFEAHLGAPQNEIS